jgi:hypothetical protein
MNAIAYTEQVTRQMNLLGIKTSDVEEGFANIQLDHPRPFLVLTHDKGIDFGDLYGFIGVTNDNRRIWIVFSVNKTCNLIRSVEIPPSSTQEGKYAYVTGKPRT